MRNSVFVSVVIFLAATVLANNDVEKACTIVTLFAGAKG